MIVKYFANNIAPIFMKKIFHTLMVTLTLILPNIAYSLTNADVLDLLAAKMSEGVILGALQTDNNPQFDVSVPSLITFKKAGATDAILSALQNKVKLESAAAQNASPQSAIVANSNNLLTARRILTITEKGNVDLNVEYYSAAPTFKARLFTGFLGGSLGIEEKLWFRPIKSPIRVASKPVFEAALEPNLNPETSLVLIKYEVDESAGTRATTMGKNRTAFKPEQILLLDFEGFANNGRTDGARKIWRFSPKNILQAGEYGIYLGKHFHGFGID